MAIEPRRLAAPVLRRKPFPTQPNLMEAPGNHLTRFGSRLHVGDPHIAGIRTSSQEVGAYPATENEPACRRLAQRMGTGAAAHPREQREDAGSSIRGTLARSLRSG